MICVATGSAQLSLLWDISFKYDNLEKSILKHLITFKSYCLCTLHFWAHLVCGGLFVAPPAVVGPKNGIIGQASMLLLIVIVYRGWFLLILLSPGLLYSTAIRSELLSDLCFKIHILKVNIWISMTLLWIYIIPTWWILKGSAQDYPIAYEETEQKRWFSILVMMKQPLLLDLSLNSLVVPSGADVI